MASSDIDPSSQDFIKKSVDFLVQPGSWTSDLMAMAKLLESHPAIFSDVPKSQFESAIRGTAEQINIYIKESSLDSLNDSADNLRILSEQFAVDIEDELSDLGGYIDELEQEPSEEYHGGGSSVTFNEDTYTDQDIRSLFSTLCD